MYRVALVDDESRIVEGLRKVISWEDYGCAVIGTADNGATGTELIRQEKPDILFMDICMPGMDGLTMLAGLRSEFPRMQVTILTGYRDFAYAQKAINLGVTRFLLKPSKMSDILEALHVMTENLKQISSSAPEDNQQDAVAEGAEGSAGNFIVNSALEYIRANYAEKLTMQTVAENCYVSQWHLSKLLSKHIGKNFYDILNEVRINEAIRLLKDSSLRVGSIGEMVGYTDSAHFARTFKKVTGKSAVEFRNSMELHEKNANAVLSCAEKKSAYSND